MAPELDGVRQEAVPAPVVREGDVLPRSAPRRRRRPRRAARGRRAGATARRPARDPLARGRVSQYAAESDRAISSTVPSTRTCLPEVPPVQHDGGSRVRLELLALPRLAVGEEPRARPRRLREAARCAQRGGAVRRRRRERHHLGPVGGTLRLGEPRPQRGDRIAAQLALVHHPDAPMVDTTISRVRMRDPSRPERPARAPEPAIRINHLVAVRARVKRLSKRESTGGQGTIRAWWPCARSSSAPRSPPPHARSSSASAVPSRGR